MGKKEKSNVQKGKTPQVQSSAQASRDDESRAAMCRVGRLILDHPVVKFGLKYGDFQPGSDLAVIKNWIEQQEEPNGGSESASETTE